MGVQPISGAAATAVVITNSTIAATAANNPSVNAAVKPVAATLKVELAQRLAGHNKIAEETLQCLFKGAMKTIEISDKTVFSEDFKKRVWGASIKDRLERLQTFFIQMFCDKILGGLEEAKLAEMLEAHKKNGVIKDGISIGYLRTAFFLSEEIITDKVLEKGKSMMDGWVPDIYKAVKQEKAPETLSATF